MLSADAARERKQQPGLVSVTKLLICLLQTTCMRLEQVTFAVAFSSTMPVATIMCCAGYSAGADSFLLACRFFDKDCAGWLEAEDLEEIAYMVCSSISREACIAISPVLFGYLRLYDNAKPSCTLIAL